MVDWQFSDAVPHDRATRLRAWKSFDAIISALLRSVRVAEKFWWEPFGQDRLKGCSRASFTLACDANVCDAFFNSPQGYRGQYACSIVEGKRANRSLLDAFESMLLQAAARNTYATVDEIVASLRATDAKVWIDETWFDDQNSDTKPVIEYLPWQHADPAGLGPGLQAPVGEVLVVKGGWIDSTGNEGRDTQKARRAYLIHSTGWSG